MKQGSFRCFIPRNRVNGSSRGFGFVLHKTEWDARKAITLLNGHLIGGNKISVQVAKFVRRKEMESEMKQGMVMYLGFDD